MKPRGKPFEPGVSGNPDGRPKSKNPKKGRMVLRATDTEWDALTERAMSAGMSVMGYVHGIVFGDSSSGGAEQIRAREDAIKQSKAT